MMNIRTSLIRFGCFNNSYILFAKKIALSARLVLPDLPS